MNTMIGPAPASAAVTTVSSCCVPSAASFVRQRSVAVRCVSDSRRDEDGGGGAGKGRLKVGSPHHHRGGAADAQDCRVGAIAQAQRRPGQDRRRREGDGTETEGRLGRAARHWNLPVGWQVFQGTRRR